MHQDKRNSAATRGKRNQRRGRKIFGSHPRTFWDLQSKKKKKKKQIAAHNLIIHYRAWTLNYLTEIGLSLEASGLIEQERRGQ